jgi:hypothetical protein
MAILISAWLVLSGCVPIPNREFREATANAPAQLCEYQNYYVGVLPLPWLAVLYDAKIRHVSVTCHEATPEDIAEHAAALEHLKQTEGRAAGGGKPE